MKDNYDPSITSIEAKQFLKQCILSNIEIELVTAAKSEGHEGLFTPLYHADLQPIELLWAFTKGNTGRSYCLGTSLQDIEEKLISELSIFNLQRGVI